MKEKAEEIIFKRNRKAKKQRKEQKTVKKTAGIFLLCTMVFTLAACGQSQESPASAGAESSSAAGRDRNSKIRSQGTDGRESGNLGFRAGCKRHGEDKSP